MKAAQFVPPLAWMWGPKIVRDTIKLKPLASWKAYSGRGMDAWHDLLDWLGGYPFEVARPDQILDFYKKRGFRETKRRLCAGGCNQFVFVREKKRR